MLPFPSPLEPLLAEAQDAIPVGAGWVYEPKWDGFRALVFREGDRVRLCSRNGQPRERYFPEVLVGLAKALPPEIVVDGEIILPGPNGLDFDALSNRIHPASSLRRQELLEHFAGHGAFFVTPQTAGVAEAKRWFHDFEGAGCDGVIARREALDYQPGKRVKVKHGRTVGCVVGGYRPGKTAGTVGSLLLGLYDEAGVLHHVGHTSSFSAKQKKALREKLLPLEGSTSFGAGRTPDAPSRWNKGKDCVTLQLLPPNPFSLATIVALSPGRVAAS